MPTFVSAPSASGASVSGLVAPRRRFLDSLSERIAALEMMVIELESEPSSDGLRARLQSRLQAMAEASSALGLEMLETAFTSADNALARATGAGASKALAEVTETLRLVPSLVPPELNGTRGAQSAPAPKPPSEPVHVEADGLTSALVSDARPSFIQSKQRAEHTPKTPSASEHFATILSPSPPVVNTAADTRSSSGQTRRPKADVSVLARRRVLVADADPAMAWFLAGVLRSANADVVEARDGLEALRFAEEQPPDLIISDVTLPELDGFGLCRNLKSDVVLCTIPVLLVAWKEDVLQRVRELGAGADGYFIKEADASTIMRRCAEVLAPRVNVEARLRKEERVQGRIDGMTPYLLLRLACDVVDHAKVTFEDAGQRTVAYLGDGRLLSVERSCNDGPAQTGEHVLAPLLGMRAGRFTVERDGECLQPIFAGSLSHVLQPEVSKIRRAMRLLQGDGLRRVARVELELEVVEPYQLASPAIVQKLTQKLLSGVMPLLLAQTVSAGLLESVLADLARRGGVRAAFDRDGRDLLSDLDVRSLPFDLDVHTPTAGYQIMAAPGAPSIGQHSAPGDAQRAAQFTKQWVEQRVEGRAPARKDPEPEAVERVSTVHDEITPSCVSAQAKVVAQAEEEARSEAANEIPLDERSEHVTLEQACFRAPESEIAAKDIAASNTAASDEVAGAANDDVDAAQSDEVPSDVSAANLLTSDASPAPMFLELAPAPSRAERSVSKAASADDECDLGSAVFGELTGSPEPEPEVKVKPTAAASAIEAPAVSREPKAASRPAARAQAPASTGDLLVADRLRNASVPLSTSADVLLAPSPRGQTPAMRPVEPARSSAAPVTTRIGQTPAPRGAVNKGQTLLLDAAAASKPRSSKTPIGSVASAPSKAPAPITGDDSLEVWVARAHRWSVEAGQWLKAHRRTLRRPLGGRTAAHAAPSTPPGRPDTRTLDVRPLPLVNVVRPAAASAPETDLDVMGLGGSETTAPPKGVRPLSDVVGNKFTTRAVAAAKRAVLPAVSVLGASALAFYGFGAIVQRVQSATPQAAANVLAPPMADDLGADGEEQAEEDDLAIAPPGAKKEAPKLQMQTVELGLPDGISVAPDKGLLEINTAGGHKIYVDDVFIGRGPVRRIPLKAGSHSVVLRLDGDEDKASVEVLAGRRVRFEPQASASAAP